MNKELFSTYHEYLSLTTQQIAEKLCTLKAKEDNRIDLNAYILGSLDALDTIRPVISLLVEEHIAAALKLEEVRKTVEKYESWKSAFEKEDFDPGDGGNFDDTFSAGIDEGEGLMGSTILKIIS